MTDELGNWTLTPRAQQVLALARKEADRLKHNFVGTEHVLLGILKLGQGTAVNVLGKLGLDLENVRDEVEKQVGTGPDQKMIGNIPYTPRVKRVIALAQQEAKQLNHAYVGTEHLLLGLLREGDGVAAKVLRSLGLEIEQIREAVGKELDPRRLFTPADAVGEKKPVSAGVQSELLDTTTRYDIYCFEHHAGLVVYRSALFKGTRSLFPGHQYDFPAVFFELEMADGRTICVSRSSVVKFCEPETSPGGEKFSQLNPGKP